jgi:hypothetical protein
LSRDNFTFSSKLIVGKFLQLKQGTNEISFTRSAAPNGSNNSGIGYDQGADKCNNPASFQESTVAGRLVAAGGGHLLQRLE